MTFTTPAWDLELFWLFNDAWRWPFLDYAMPILSYTPLIWFVGVLAALACLYCGYHNWKRLVTVLLFIGISVGATDIACNLIKAECSRMRPHQSLAGVHYMSDGEWKQNPPAFEAKYSASATSFVSSHAANCTALIVSLMLFLPWTRPWLALLPIFVGWSRLYLGKHFPLDIIAGYAVGACIALTVWYGYKALLRYAKRRGFFCSACECV